MPGFKCSPAPPNSWHQLTPGYAALTCGDAMVSSWPKAGFNPPQVDLNRSESESLQIFIFLIYFYIFFHVFAHFLHVFVHIFWIFFI